MSHIQGASLDCPICCELFDNACETVCGHAFCEFCIHKSLETTNCCPICRKDPSPIHPSFTLRALVQEERQRRGEDEKQSQSTTDGVDPIQTDAQQADMEKGGPVHEQYLGNVCYRRSQYAEAIKHYNKAILQKPNAVLYGNRAASYFKLRQFRASLEDYEKAELFDSNNVKLLLGKALTLEKLRYFKQSYTTFQQSLSLNPQGQLRMDILAGLHRIVSMARFLVPPTAITTIAPMPSSSPSSSYGDLSTAMNPPQQQQLMMSIQTVPAFQWQIHQELTFKEFLGAI